MIVRFVRALRAAGVSVPVKSTVLYADALEAVGAERESSMYWAGRATLVPRHDDIATYDRVFASFWQSSPEPAAPAERVPLTIVLDDEGEPSGDRHERDEARLDDGETIVVRYSPTELLRHKDFAAYTADELREAQRLMADLRLAGALRRSRRLKPSRRPRGQTDVRRTMRSTMRTHGEAVRRHHRQPGSRPRRVVLLCDISGSMEPYSRALLRFVHAAVAGRVRVEAFALGTRLTRLTRELSSRDPDAALARTSSAVEDWSGGTRLGESLRRFNDEWGVRGMARGAVVAILSDGWDRGDPSELAAEMARLHRVAFRVVWVNPLKATPGYQPLAQGMAAALPYVDDFVEGHNLAALDDLARVIAAG
ncbi:MAG: VWA domain-containing protein [Actinobacteria bacterium]|nr:VWA domain-containing protein [Actinomycetota bacterium]